MANTPKIIVNVKRPGVSVNAGSGTPKVDVSLNEPVSVTAGAAPDPSLGVSVSGPSAAITPQDSNGYTGS